VAAPMLPGPADTLIFRGCRAARTHRGSRPGSNPEQPENSQGASWRSRSGPTAPRWASTTTWWRIQASRGGPGGGPPPSSRSTTPPWPGSRGSGSD